MSFSAQWVFPGGMLSAVDGDPGLDLHAALRRAAVRETREEAGVSLPLAGRGDTPGSTALIPWSRWITPAGRPRRFDAWFFAAALPAGVIAAGDGAEAVETRWVGPEEALAERDAGRMPMMPPTAVTLMDLAGSFRRHGSVAALLEAERSREIVPIVPRLTERPEGLFSVYPWDAEYERLPGEGIVLERVPEYLRRLPSRMPAPRLQP